MALGAQISMRQTPAAIPSNPEYGVALVTGLEGSASPMPRCLGVAILPPESVAGPGRRCKRENCDGE
jgi:hypothetical protein